MALEEHTRGGDVYEAAQVRERAALYRRDPAFAAWAAGYGVIRHDDLTQLRIHELLDLLVERDPTISRADRLGQLAAADRLASAAMWLVVHMTYARRVRLDGSDLEAVDFKKKPEGHTGGALNMVPAYVGYLTADALSGVTRGWLMGQGHCVAAIDSVNLLVGNTSPEHAACYDLTDRGLTQLVNDFYSYQIRPDGRPASPLGSHVNPHTAGGLIEGGYLGFAELEYVHMPLPGERLVAFLSDGSFEEQRGSDWAPRWWRAEDSGLVAPIMIANGRRIEERTTMAQSGGVEWFKRHLRLNSFDPVDIDGRDPAAFAWAILEMEERLSAAGSVVTEGRAQYPVPLPYGIAEAPKGFGFPGAGTNLAHNLPLGGNPSVDPEAREAFHQGARQLWVPPAELSAAAEVLSRHAAARRPRERDNPIAARQVPAARLPEPEWRPTGEAASPMAALDHYFVRLVKDNPELRPRVGNPDELRSNRMNETLETLKHRVTSPEPGVAEAVDGKVITALNEEAVVCAALGNKGGLNLVVSYEAFAVKMLGALRQEILFSRHQREVGRPPQWLSVPLLLSSHIWENGKNEQSHQDPTLAEALLGEMSDVSRVLFPADANSALAALGSVYASRGEIAALVVPKLDIPSCLTPEQARRLLKDGALALLGADHPEVLFVAVGAYQLVEAMKAAARLSSRGRRPEVIYLQEPGRFREPRDAKEAARMAPEAVRRALFPEEVRARVFLCHTRPEALLGVVRPLDTGRGATYALGYQNHGGTLDVAGMLFANGVTWGHAVAKAALALDCSAESLLSAEEMAAILGRGEPAALLSAKTR